jgi:hypothetical protein
MLLDILSEREGTWRQQGLLRSFSISLFFALVSHPHQPNGECDEYEGNRDHPIDPEPMAYDIRAVCGIPIEHGHGEQ